MRLNKAAVVAATAIAALFVSIVSVAPAHATPTGITATQVGTLVNIQVNGWNGGSDPSAGYIAFARLSGSYVTGSGGNVNSAGLKVEMIPSNLGYGTTYTLVSCIGTAPSTCTGPEYTTSLTTSSLSTPSVAVTGTSPSGSIAVSASGANPSGAYVFYAASDLTTALVARTPAASYSWSSLSSYLSTGVNYVVKYCEGTGMSCTGTTYFSAASTNFQMASATPPAPTRVLSSNKNATFVVCGKPATNGSIVEITGVPSNIGVLVSLADNRANATVSVPATPVLGNNLVTVFVYAEDGSVQENNITVHISTPVVTPPVVVPPAPKPSSDATAAIKANGTAIADGGVINLPAGTTSVAVTVTPTESHATATVAGATALLTGNNTVTVTVTAQDGSKKTYSFTAAVAAPLSADATATITVAGITVNDGDHVNLPFGTTQVAVAVTPTESHANYSVAGATGLATGTSVLTVTVTAQNGATKAYTYQLVVAADTTPVSVAGSSVSALDRVKAALAAGRAAMVTFSAKGAAAHASVVAQIRIFKAAARAAGISGRISFTITDASNSATAVVRVG